jgi:lipid-A-disaccharide synthase
MLLLQNSLPAGFDHASEGVVLHLGGDPFLTWLIAKRFRQPCLAYADRPFALQSRFDRVFYSGAEPVPGMEGNGGRAAIGELAVDAAHRRCPKREPFRGGKISVGLYPGSREAVARHMLPFFGAVADGVSRSMPGIEWMLAKSDFLPVEFFQGLADAKAARPLEGVSLRWEESDGGAVLVTEKGNRIEVVAPGVAAARANLALMVPGAGTAELAALGVPMIVALPGFLGEAMPLPGLAGSAGSIPVVGGLVHRGASLCFSRKDGYHSHPNRRCGRMLVPEVVGEFSAQQVAKVVIQTLTAETRALEEELKAVMGPPGAARHLAEEVRALSRAPQATCAGAVVP